MFKELTEGKWYYIPDLLEDKKEENIVVQNKKERKD